MTLIRRLAATAIAAFPLASAPAADAAVERVVVRQGPLTVAPYEVRYTSARTRAVRSPRLDGYLVRMHARVVDRAGRPMPVQRVMLHHVVYKTRAHRDPVCGGTESFYGTGEENQALRLPPGYGYSIRRSDRWLTGWMLMNHQARTQRAYIEYTAWVETSQRLRGVRPYWVRATGCDHARDPIFNVPGGAGPGATYERSADWIVPRSGRLVAGGSHVHGGARELRLSQPACGDRTLMSSRPLYGLPDHPYYNVLPVLHEPGPIATSWITSPSGIQVTKGERLHVTAVYDGERPHVRAMGIWHVYLAPGRAAATECPPLPADTANVLPEVLGRLDPPAVEVPLTGLDDLGRAITIDRPPGPLVRSSTGAEVTVTNSSYSARNLLLPLGATVRWRFRGRGFHDVTLANGPVGFASRWSRRGASYRRRFTQPGVYRIFCSLHPIQMTQAIEVRRTP
jgi:plastocyanin